LLLLQGFLYSGDDGGKLCKWTSGLSLEWVRDTYAGRSQAWGDYTIPRVPECLSFVGIGPPPPSLP
jgi:hypothetical protein